MAAPEGAPSCPPRETRLRRPRPLSRISIAASQSAAAAALQGPAQGSSHKPSAATLWRHDSRTGPRSRAETSHLSNSPPPLPSPSPKPWPLSLGHRNSSSKHHTGWSPFGGSSPTAGKSPRDFAGALLHGLLSPLTPRSPRVVPLAPPGGPQPPNLPAPAAANHELPGHPNGSSPRGRGLLGAPGAAPHAPVAGVAEKGPSEAPDWPEKARTSIVGGVLANLLKLFLLRKLESCKKMHVSVGGSSFDLLRGRASSFRIQMQSFCYEGSRTTFAEARTRGIAGPVRFDLRGGARGGRKLMESLVPMEVSGTIDEHDCSFSVNNFKLMQETLREYWAHLHSRRATAPGPAGREHVGADAPSGCAAASCHMRPPEQGSSEPLPPLPNFRVEFRDQKAFLFPEDPHANDEQRSSPATALVARHRALQQGSPATSPSDLRGTGQSQAGLGLAGREPRITSVALPAAATCRAEVQGPIVFEFAIQEGSGGGAGLRILEAGRPSFARSGQLKERGLRGDGGAGEKDGGPASQRWSKLVDVPGDIRFKYLTMQDGLLRYAYTFEMDI